MKPSPRLCPSPPTPLNNRTPHTPSRWLSTRWRRRGNRIDGGLPVVGDVIPPQLPVPAAQLVAAIRIGVPVGSKWGTGDCASTYPGAYSSPGMVFGVVLCYSLLAAGRSLLYSALVCFLPLSLVLSPSLNLCLPPPCSCLYMFLLLLRRLRPSFRRPGQGRRLRFLYDWLTYFARN